MISTLTQEDIDIFSSDPAGAKERPGTPYYAEGVEVGYTAPAKWWNWLWNAITTFFTGSKSDRQNILTELNNTLGAASITTNPLYAHQLTDAINVISYSRADTHDNQTVNGVKVNQARVEGYSLILPDTELL